MRCSARTQPPIRKPLPAVAKKLLDEMFCRFSLPEKLHSDQGRQFEGEVVTQLCQLLAMEKTRTTPYHPQSDGLVERFNGTLLSILTMCLEDHPTEWDQYLSKLCMAYNSSVQRPLHLMG